MTILLTGGAGYIGSHTAVELVRAGYDVVVADDHSNSSPDVLRRVARICEKEVPARAFNVADGVALEQLFQEFEFQAVVHFAGFKAVSESVAEPVRYYRNNLDSTLTLLETMARHGVHRLVFSSSATVYGQPPRSPITEDMPVGRCFSPYGRAKYFIEQILTDTAAADQRLSVALLRYFNPIGAHESGLLGEMPNGVPNNLMPFITQTAAGIREKLSVFGNDYDTRDGTGVRDYIHVVDLAKGHVAALGYTAAHTGVEAFNLGTGVGYSVLDIVNTFRQVNGVPVPYVFAPRRPGDIAEFYADPGKAKRLLGWQAEKTLADMCRDAWRWECRRGSFS